MVPEEKLPHSPEQAVQGVYQRALDSYDESALELALRLRDQAPETELTAVTVSAQEDARVYESLYALGFSEVVRIDCALPPFSPRATAELLAEAVRGADLILAGRQSGLAGTQMVPRHLAQRLGLPYVDHVCALEACGGGVRFRAAGDGKITEGTLTAPAVLLAGDAGWLRIPTLKARLAAKKLRCRTVLADAPQCEELRPAALYRPPAREACRWITGTAEEQAAEILSLLEQSSAARRSEDADQACRRKTYGGALIAEYAQPPELPAPWTAPSEQWVSDWQERADDCAAGLGKAELVFLAGRGVSQPSERETLRLAAEKAGAQIGATRAAVLAGWYPIGLQVGISGLNLQAGAVLLFGASGAAALTAGLDACGTVIAVNKDPEAPVFRRADYGVQADCGEILRAMQAQLERK